MLVGLSLLLLSSRNFMVSGFKFKPLSHFESIFVCGVREWSSFIVLYVAVHFSQHHLSKRLSSLLDLLDSSVCCKLMVSIHGFISWFSVLFH